MTATHPGSITFVDGDAQTEKVLSAAEVPESLRFASNEKGEVVPVVRVVARIAGNQRFISQFGSAGELLRTTVQRSEP